MCLECSIQRWRSVFYLRYRRLFGPLHERPFPPRTHSRRVRQVRDLLDRLELPLVRVLTGVVRSIDSGTQSRIRTTTLAPRSVNLRVSQLPKSPVAPVTNTLRSIQKPGFVSMVKFTRSTPHPPLGFAVLPHFIEHFPFPIRVHWLPKTGVRVHHQFPVGSSLLKGLAFQHEIVIV